MFERGQFKLKQIYENGSRSEPISHNGKKLKFRYAKDAYTYIMKYLDSGTYALVIGNNYTVWIFTKR